MLKPEQYRALALEYAQDAIGEDAVDMVDQATVYDANGGAWVTVLVFVSDEAVVASQKGDDDR